MTAVKRWAPWALLIVIAAVGLGIGLHRPSHPSLDAQVMHIAGEVRCPVCNGETVAESQAAVSVDIRNRIRTELNAHQSQSQILAGLVQSYGAGILEKPQPDGLGVLVWVVPVIAVASGATGLGFMFYRWRSRPAVAGPADEPAAVSGATAPPAEVTPMPAAAVPPGRRWPRWAVLAAGVAFVTGGACWALIAATATRLPGQTITGRSLAPQAVAAALQQAQLDAARGDAVGAVKEYEKVLAADPNQTEALTGEGWVLAQTGEPALLQQGVGLLTSAERSDPTYAPAHVYRGLAYMSEDDYQDALPELQWYLAHHPDPSLVARVRTLLAQAQAGVAAAARASRAAGPTTTIAAPTPSVPRP